MWQMQIAVMLSCLSAVGVARGGEPPMRLADPSPPKVRQAASQPDMVPSGSRMQATTS